MEEHTPNEAQSVVGSNLLTPEERGICRAVAQADAPHNQRALALLALDQGVTQTDASELSGLTQGQVRYWRDKFGRERLNIFPPSVLAVEAPATTISLAEIRLVQARRSEPTAVSNTAKPKNADKKKKKKKADKKKSGGAKTKKPKDVKREKGKKKEKTAKKKQKDVATQKNKKGKKGSKPEKKGPTIGPQKRKKHGV